MHISSRSLIISTIAGAALVLSQGAMAQDSATTGVVAETAADQDDTSGPDDEPNTDWTGGVGTGMGTGSMPWYPYRYISCSSRDGYVSGGGPGFPGIPYPGYPGSSMPNHGATGSPIQCIVNGQPGAVFYNCSCGGSEYSSGQLVGSWFATRPTDAEMIGGCKDIFKEQCGNTRETARVNCGTDYGNCSAQVVVRDDAQTRTELSFRCDCIDNTQWNTSQLTKFAEYPSVLTLNERCEAEVSRCGSGQVGIAGSGLLGSPEKQLSAACRTSFGDCFMQRSSDGRQSLNCGCRGGERKSLDGDLGWSDAPAKVLLETCADEVNRCNPAGLPGIVDDLDGGQGTGASSSPDASSTAGANAPAQPAPKVHCAMAGDSGRLGYTLLGGLALLGWRRRRRA